MLHRTISLSLVILFVHSCCAWGQVHEKPAMAKETHPPLNAVPTKQAAPPSEQVDEIETAAFRSLLTSAFSKPDPKYTKGIVLTSNQNDRKDLRFLNDLHLGSIVVHPLSDIATRKTFLDKHKRKVSELEYKKPLPGVKEYALRHTKWISDTQVEVSWFVCYTHKCGYGGTYELVRKQGKWIVKGIKKWSEYRT